MIAGAITIKGYPFGGENARGRKAQKEVKAMKNEPFKTMLQSGKIKLATVPSVGNGTVKSSATPFPQQDNIYYQVGPAGDFLQETH